jgi:hypothetical protein
LEIGCKILGDRFYQQQRDTLGTCPGSTTRKRKKQVAWTDEEREKAVEMYTSAEPTPENSMEIVKGIAEELEKTPNGVRMMLQKAEVYVKKAAPAGGSSASSASGGGGKRVSKEAAQEALRSALSDAGQEVDDDIVGKLTGKAAMYFAGVIQAINEAS